MQIAKAFGAEVTGVSSTNVDLVRSIGADHVIDYTEEDFTKGDRAYDFILDNVGNHPCATRAVRSGDGGICSPMVRLSMAGSVASIHVVEAMVQSMSSRKQGRLFVVLDTLNGSRRR